MTSLLNQYSRNSTVRWLFVILISINITACFSEKREDMSLTYIQSLPQHQVNNVWFQQAQSNLKDKMKNKVLTNSASSAKNVILFVGDGMGVSTVSAARILQGQLAGNNGEENLLSFERFPFSGFSKTYNVDQQTPDSAGTMTAMMTGVKTDAGLLSVDEQSNRGDCASAKNHRLTTVLELAELAGKATGIVTTARITHATPAASYAKSVERDWEDDSELSIDAKASGCVDIAQQLLAFKGGIDVALGGGRKHFLPEAQKGSRQDGKNLISQWQTLYPQGQYVDSKQQLLALDSKINGPLLGLFNDSHMDYSAEHSVDKVEEPSLSDMTRIALSRLKKNDEGFFLIVEAGRIDHGHHAGNAYNALHETIELSDAVALTLEQVDLTNTLVVVTADHSHVMTFAGYPKRGNPILGKVVAAGENTPTLADDGLPYTTLSYMNGRGMHSLGHEGDADRVNKLEINVGRKDISKIDTELPGYHQEALIPRHSETHGGEDVGIYAAGPGAQWLTGVNEQNMIFHVIAQSLLSKDESVVF
ncbi:Alkaline phosphatase family protein [Oleispira antarctica RB-8]|uniref:Alkaline phosphatase family protein n=1 Tax=Oleispira antarctica RB-8 TaxID=698738 RepID=R4YKG1_OLEAN|nr:Alkaline phosphatase family protein [Oleispira antarctica RB-8]